MCPPVWCACVRACVCVCAGVCCCVFVTRAACDPPPPLVGVRVRRCVLPGEIILLAEGAIKVKVTEVLDSRELKGVVSGVRKRWL